MKKNKLRKRTSRKEQAAVPMFPSWDDPGRVLDCWRGSISNGFSPVALTAALGAIPPECPERDSVECLSVLAGSWLSPSGIHCPDWAPASALLDRENGCLFFAGASHEGLGCFEAVTGKPRWKLPHGTLGRAGGMALGPAGLYVCDRWRRRVLVLNPETGKEREVIEVSPEGRPLDEPSDVLLLERDGNTEIWVCERGNHSICRFAEDGGPLERVGSRGLAYEETAQRFTGPPGGPEALMFEFPDSLNLGMDIDRSPAVFVSDSYNGRMVVLGTDGSFKRVITLAAPGAPKFSGQVRLVSMPDGPLVLALNEVDRTLDVHDHEGAPLLRLSLLSPESGSGRAGTFARFVDCAELPLVADGGSILSFTGPLLDTPVLLESLVRLFPARNDLRLSLAERRRIKDLPLNYDESFPGLPPAELVSSLLVPEQVPGRGLARSALRVEGLVRALSGDGHAPELAAALCDRLASLADRSYPVLLSFARPEEQTLDRWSDALADLDMALVQTKGRNQQKEMELDDILEEIREHPDRTRHAAWTWRELNIIRRSLGALDISSLAGRVAKDALSLLRLHRELLSGLSPTVDPRREPSHIRRDELVSLHRVLQAGGALERVVNHLADCLIENLAPETILSTPVLDTLALCASLDLPSGKWSRLYETLHQAVSPSIGEGAHLPVSTPDKSAAALENMRALIENMTRYLKALNAAGGAGGPFARVVVRQKEIFAVKGSLLANTLFHNGAPPAEALELAARAAKLAGAAWDETKNLRFSAPHGESL